METRLHCQSDRTTCERVAFLVPHADYFVVTNAHIGD
jgi:hypothetical protein